MEYRIERSNSDTGRIKVIRLQTASARTSRFKPIVRAPLPAILSSSELLNPPDVAPLSRTMEDSSPAVTARRVRRRLRRLWELARRAAKRQARLCRADEYGLLKCAYAAVRCWQQDGVVEEIQRELRKGAEVAISRGSNLFLVLIRSALPRLDPKRTSKWSSALELANYHAIPSKRLAGFLHANGGIEGAARERARLRVTTHQLTRR